MATGFASAQHVQKDASNELRIVLIGPTGAGKSATGNTLINAEKNVFKSSARRQSVTKECAYAETERYGKKLVVVDTPGIFDTTMDEDAFKTMFIECTYLACPGVHAFLYVMKIGDRDIGEKDAKAMRQFNQLLGEHFPDRTIVVFTGKDTLDAAEEDLRDFLEGISSECMEFIQSCKGGVVSISNTKGDAEKENAALQIIEKVDVLVEKNGGRNKYYKNVLFDESNQEINARMNQILNDNNKIRAQLQQVDENMKRLRGCIVNCNPTEEQRELQQKLSKQMDDLQKEIVDRKTARVLANNKIEFERKVKKLQMIIGGTLATVGIVAGTAAAITNPAAALAVVSAIVKNLNVLR